MKKIVKCGLLISVLVACMIFIGCGQKNESADKKIDIDDALKTKNSDVEKKFGVKPENSNGFGVELGMQKLGDTDYVVHLYYDNSEMPVCINYNTSKENISKEELIKFIKDIYEQEKSNAKEGEADELPDLEKNIEKSEPLIITFELKNEYNCAINIIQDSTDEKYTVSVQRKYFYGDREKYKNPDYRGQK